MKQAGEETLRMVATDGHRLSLIDRKSEKISGVAEKGMILPKKGVLEVKKIIGDREREEAIGIYFNATHGFFRLGKSLTVIRLIEGEFPEYEQVIPKGNDRKLLMTKERMYSSLKRVSTMTSERMEGIKFSIKKKFGGDVHVSSRFWRCQGRGRSGLRRSSFSGWI
jgi:DNA polymerase-3 subunit beta